MVDSAIEKQLARMDDRLANIEAAMSKIAVQNEQICELQRRVSAVELKMSPMERWQASCPRSQIKWFWMIVVGQGTLMLGIGIKLLQGP